MHCSWCHIEFKQFLAIVHGQIGLDKKCQQKKQTEVNQVMLNLLKIRAMDNENVVICEDDEAEESPSSLPLTTHFTTLEHIVSPLAFVLHPVNSINNQNSCYSSSSYNHAHILSDIIGVTNFWI